MAKDNYEIRKAIDTLHPFIYVQTEEEGRFLFWVQQTYGANKTYDFRVYDPSLGLKPLADYINLWSVYTASTLQIDPNTSDPNAILSRVLRETSPVGRVYTIFLGCDSTILSGRDPMLTRRMHTLANQIHMNNQAFKVNIFVGNSVTIPPGMERMFKVTYFELPEATSHKEMLDGYLKSDHLPARMRTTVDTASVANEMKGLTHYESSYCALSSFLISKKLGVEEVALFKRDSISKNPLLELVEPKISFKDVGGMSRLKEYLNLRKNSWSPEGKKYGLPRFKGVLQVGLPGNGKSLSCKAMAKEYGIPLIKFDPAKVFGGTVGSSETNMRRALHTMELASPCCVWIDEIEKGLAGIQSSSFSDSGTTSRVIGTFLNWMQECDKDVIIMATANTITDLPPELLRRFDEIFFVGMPARDQLREIWEIQITKVGRDPKNFEIMDLVHASKNRCGSEIEIAVGAAMFAAFAAKREMNTEDLLTAVKGKPPIIITMKEQLQGIIDWVGKDPQTGDGVRARFAHAIDSSDVSMEIV